MAWNIEISSKALSQLDALDPQIAKRLLKFLFSRLLPLNNPRAIGESLKGERLGDYWKYRVGDYRIVASINDKVSILTVVHIGNRRDVYRNIR